MTAARPARPAARRALLADGAVVTVRELGPADRADVARLHRDLPLDDHYLRFFTGSRPAAELVADTVLSGASVAVGAHRGGRLVGVAHYVRGAPGTAPEVAVVVTHDAQHRGVASLLLEHLVDRAREDGVAALVADVLAVNGDMLAVLRDCGLPVHTERDGEVCRVRLDLAAAAAGAGAERYVEAVLSRAERAGVAALRPVLAPRSVAVVGAGRRPGSVGRAVLRRIVECGFPGPVHVVHPHTAAVAGVPCVPAVGDLPRDVDLVVLAVPAAAVPGLAEECGRRGVRALLVLSAGISTDPVLAAGLDAAVRRYGLRVVGPNCLGLVNTAAGLQAGFGPAAEPGAVGVVAQSGGVLIAVTGALASVGLGVSTAVSTGDALDVNADDLLSWWTADPATQAAVVHVESLRRPRQFARLARRLARRMPVVTVRSGSSEVGRRAAASHTAATATPRVVRDGLIAQAGLLAVDEITDVAGVLALLAAQPLPRGPRVAVVSNAGGLGVLAADACTAAGLTVVATGDATRAALAALLPQAAALAGPVDTGATVPAAVFRQVIGVVGADPGVDAVMAVGVPTALGDPLASPGPEHPWSGAVPGVPVVAVRPGRATAVDAARSGTPGWTPSFAEPAAAARALAAAVRRARWLQRPADPAPDPPGVDAAAARRVVSGAFAGDPAGGWLDPARATALLAAAGIPVVATTVVPSARDAVRVWREHGGPVALKADAAGLVHRSRAGGVATGVDSAERVRATVRDFRERFGSALRGVVVQPMAAPGLELLVGATADPLCGPLLTVGLGGVATDLVDDRAHCLVPATTADLDDLVDGLRAAPRLARRADAAALRSAVRDAAARLAWLGALLPEVAEAEVNPLVWAEGTAHAVDVRVRLAPAVREDPYLRVLPT